MGKRRFLAACGVVFLVLFTMVSCDSILGKLTGDDDDDEDTYQLTGTLTKSGVQGRYAYLKLVQQGANGGAAAIYWAKSTAFDLSNNARYEITGIEKGTYTGYAFIDAGGSTAVGDGTSQPDDGDWTVDQGRDFTFGGDQVGDIPGDSWIAYDDGLYTMSGTLTKPNTVSIGSIAYMKLVASGEDMNASALYSTSVQFTGDNATFTISGIAAGSYTGYAFIDADGSAVTSPPTPYSGDWIVEPDNFSISGDSSENNIDSSSWVHVFDLTGTLTLSGASGHYAYLKLVAEGGGPGAEALYFAVSDVFDSGDNAMYQMPLVAAGTYDLYAFIDMDDDAAGDETSEPDIDSDYSYDILALTIDGTACNIGGGDWALNL